MPKVSIIIPAFNAAATIVETLKSTETQEFQDFEVIVVDDGSTDATVEVVRREFPGVRVIQQENAGPAAARNHGAAEAQGEWLAFLDADDVWLPWRLGLEVSFANQNPDVDLWCGRGFDFEISDSALRSRFTEFPTSRELDKFASGRTEHMWRLTLNDLRFANPIATSTVLIKSTAFEEIGGFDTRFYGPEDYDLWIRFLARFKAVKINLPVSRYRQHDMGLSQDERRFIPEVLKVIDRAYGKQGELHSFGWLGKRQAKAYQMMAMAWVALTSSRKHSAVKLFFHSILLWPFSFPNAKRRFPRLGILRKMLKSE